MEKRQSDQSIGDVSLSPIYPSNISPAAPTITSSAPQGTYYVMSENTNQTTIYATPHNESFTRNANVGLLPASNPGPSRGRWRDSICSWVANLWPSCGCLFIGCGGWHVAQIAQKTNCMKFETIIVPYVIIYVIIGFLTLFFSSLLWLIPFFIVFFIALILRFHVIKTYQIQQNHCFVEFLFGFFCCPCSITQMSRHVFGYRESLDGDSRPLLPDYYDPPNHVSV